MEKYIVIKSFFKLDEKKDYNVGDIVELSKDDADRLLRNEFVEKPKVIKAKK